MASSSVYKSKIEAEGLAFSPVRPDAGELLERPDLMARLLDQRNGTELLLREYLIPQVRAGFEDLVPICRKADLLVSHVASFAGPIVGEHLGLRWISVCLQPAALFSRYDPLVIAKAPWLRHLYWLGPRFAQVLFKIADYETRRWAAPIFNLRREIGLPANSSNPVMWGQHSPWCVLALFSPNFAPPQRDWPCNLAQAGFLFYDALGGALPGVADQDGSLLRLQSFLESGPPPVLFTLGSSAVMQPGDFFSESIKAARQLRQRAVLLVGKNRQGQSLAVGADIFVASYLPYSKVMPKVAATVHSGGIGTTAQALRAGRPVLVVPWSNDQPDNAYRLKKLGVARVLARSKYRGETAARQLRALLANRQMVDTSRHLAEAIASEDSLAIACSAIESVLHQ